MKGRIGDSGRASEKKLANRVGGRQTLGSGALMGDKGDVRTGSWLIEAKSTITKKYSLALADLVKISREAAMKGLKPAFSVNFVDPKGTPVPYGKWMLVQEDEYLELKALAEREE